MKILSHTRFRVRETAFSDFLVHGLNVALKNSGKSPKTKSQVFIASCNIVECVNMQTENKRGNNLWMKSESHYISVRECIT